MSIIWDRNSDFRDGGDSARKAAEKVVALPTPPPVRIAYMETFINRCILKVDQALSGGQV